MILNPKSTTVAYRCPYCGDGVVSMVGIFALSAELLRLKCACGQSALTIKYERGDSGERKIRLSVPCLLCPNPHMFVVTPNVFFNRELFMLQCSASGVDIFFAGDKNKVMERMDEVKDELLELCDAYPDPENNVGVDAGGTGDPDEAFKRLTDFNAQLINGGRDDAVDFDQRAVDIMRYAVADMCEAGEISCGCDDPADARYNVTFENGEMRVECATCGAKMAVKLSGLDAATRFLESGGLQLK